MSPSAHVESYYTATTPDLPVYPAPEGRLRAEVCVVGGGYTGLSAALELAERGFDVVLLEAERVGWGASGRNGGQICTGFHGSLAHLAAWVGMADARRLFALSEEGKAIIRERVRRHAIDCDLTWGYFHAATKPRHLRELAGLRDSWAECGYRDTELVEGRQAAAAHVDSPIYTGGLYEAGAGHLHPLRYCLGLARAAEAAGVRLFEGARVTALARGVPARLDLATAQVEADVVVFCGNAYLGDLVPEIRTKVLPVGSFIAATAPLGAARAGALIPGNAAVSDSNYLLNYYRLSSDNRLLFGGRVHYSADVPTDLPQAMRRKMLKVFPSLHDVAFEHVWGGYIALTPERTPHIGRLDGNLYFAQGFSGQGVVLTGLVGRILAEAVAGERERLALVSRLPHRSFPGGRRLAAPILGAATLWYRLKDAM